MSAHDTTLLVHRTIPESLAGERLDKALAGLLRGLSPARVGKLARQGALRQDGRNVGRTNVRAQAGAGYQLKLPLIEAAETELEVATGAPASDEHLFALSKPAGLLTHGTGRSSEASLADLAEVRFGPLPRDAGEERPGIVHRLDRETSGILVLAKTSQAMQALRDAFRARTVNKRYLALVQGVPAQDEWTIDAPLAPRSPGHHADSDRQAIDPDGKAARTDFTVLERGPVFSWIACRPHSGRRHQIRVHLAASDLWIAGDPLYRPPTIAPGAPGRMALHAESLSLAHPVTGEPWTARADLAPDLQPWCDPSQLAKLTSPCL